MGEDESVVIELPTEHYCHRCGGLSSYRKPLSQPPNPPVALYVCESCSYLSAIAVLFNEGRFLLFHGLKTKGKTPLGERVRMTFGYDEVEEVVARVKDTANALHSPPENAPTN